MMAIATLFIGGIMQKQQVYSLATSSVAQSYTTSDQELTVGMAAALSAESTADKQIVERATLTNKDRFVGIVSTIDSNLLSLTNGSANVTVTGKGEVAVFASDVGGQIKKGDFLVISPLKGILMKAPSNTANVLGQALQDFPADGATVKTVKANKGKDVEVKINKMPFELNPRNVNNEKDVSFVVLIGQTLTGRNVNEFQVITAFLIFFFLILVEGAIVYGATSSTIAAVGRNPLAKKIVYKQLFQVALIMLVIFGFGMSAIYAILYA